MCLQNKDGENKSNGIGDGVGDGHDDDGRGRSELQSSGEAVLQRRKMLQKFNWCGPGAPPLHVLYKNKLQIIYDM